jgi:hypothetical protein
LRDVACGVKRQSGASDRLIDTIKARPKGYRENESLAGRLWYEDALVPFQCEWVGETSRSWAQASLEAAATVSMRSAKGSIVLYVLH